MFESVSLLLCKEYKIYIKSLFHGAYFHVMELVLKLTCKKVFKS